MHTTLSHFVTFVWQLHYFNCGGVTVQLVQISVSSLLNQDELIMGAVGAYAWSGTVVHQNAQGTDIFPYSTFQDILQDKDQSSLLGVHQ